MKKIWVAILALIAMVFIVAPVIVAYVRWDVTWMQFRVILIGVAFYCGALWVHFKMEDEDSET